MTANSGRVHIKFYFDIGELDNSLLIYLLQELMALDASVRIQREKPTVHYLMEWGA
jgi:hypothetical protein